MSHRCRAQLSNDTLASRRNGFFNCLACVSEPVPAATHHPQCVHGPLYNSWSWQVLTCVGIELLPVLFSFMWRATNTKLGNWHSSHEMDLLYSPSSTLARLCRSRCSAALSSCTELRWPLWRIISSTSDYNKMNATPEITFMQLCQTFSIQITGTSQTIRKYCSHKGLILDHHSNHSSFKSFMTCV